MKEIKLGQTTIKIDDPVGNELPIEINGNRIRIKEKDDSASDALDALKALADPDIPKIFSFNPT